MPGKPKSRGKSQIEILCLWIGLSPLRARRPAPPQRILLRAECMVQCRGTGLQIIESYLENPTGVNFNIALRRVGSVETQPLKRAVTDRPSFRYRTPSIPGNAFRVQLSHRGWSAK